VPAELRAVGVPSHLRLNARVRDLQGRIVGESRDLEVLKRDLRPAQQRARRAVAEDFAREGVRTWDFGTLPEGVELERGGLTLKVYPAIEDRGNAVAVTCEDSAERAQCITRRGVIRLLALRLEPQLRYLRKALAADTQLGLLHHPLGPLRTLIDDLCDRAVERCCLPDGEPTPRDAAAFEAAAEAGRSELYEEGLRVAGIVKQALAERREAIAAIEALPDRTDPALAEDCLGQVQRLAGERLVRDAPDPWLDQLPRLLRAATRRAEKLRLARRHDVDAQHELREWHGRLADVETEAAARHAGEPGEVALLRWMVAEYGVSLFAQELRTSMPVSAKRLARQLDQARRALSA